MNELINDLNAVGLNVITFDEDDNTRDCMECGEATPDYCLDQFGVCDDCVNEVENEDE